MASRTTWTLLVTGVAALAACDDKAGGAGHEVRALEIPTKAEREADDLFAEAKALSTAGRDKQAEPVLRRVLELAPRHARALAMLSAQLLERRRFDEAATLLRRLVEATPEDAAARRMLFEALYGKRDYAGAETVARDWTHRAGDSSDAYFALGSALHEEGRLGDAVTALKQAASLKASRADVRSRLGLVYQAQGKLAQAEAAQRDAIQRDPRYGEAWLRLADLMELAGPARRTDEIEAFRRAVAADPLKFGFANADLYRLMRLAAGGEAPASDELDAQWKTLVGVARRDMLPWNGLGSAPPDSAGSAADERALRDAVAAHPDDAQARMKFAMHLHRRGELAEAVDEYAEAMLGDPKDAHLRAALGAALLVKGDTDAAELQLREAVRLDPSDETAWRNLGWALLELGHDDDAIAVFDEALKRVPGDHLAKRARGLARMHKGDLDGGRKDVAESGWTFR